MAGRPVRELPARWFYAGDQILATVMSKRERAASSASTVAVLVAFIRASCRCDTHDGQKLRGAERPGLTRISRWEIARPGW